MDAPAAIEDSQLVPEETSLLTTSIRNDGVVITWEPKVADEIRKKVEEHKATRESPDQPFMIGVVGIPGSGKTTSCWTLADMLTSGLDGKSKLPTMVMPFDGYHYSVDQLLTFENPDDVIYRRGAPDTFDPKSLESDLKRIRNGQENIVKIPGFDHAVGDPEPDAHTFNRNVHDVVICEGLYLFHDEDGWDSIMDQFDYSIFVKADVDTCVDRLKERNKCIPGYTPEEIELRCDVVDRKNAMTVQRSSHRAAVAVTSAAFANSDVEEEEECQIF
eukprot:CAMPEP_0195305336 /NCGR_PEP_ID=MMETSP0707-20130614/36107_1 /TAXON_ID=33640 /ORGANISM="Asterionellopsis glacialis, Strain CCMP134" /LENGTH=273 /DNA_ID=CAMNT_0040369423 /DNA_START=232 /DNA_END=1053 /DNA_ORIENTATION=-